MKLFYLFTERGVTDRFYCGNIYEQLPTDTIRVHGQPMTFQEAAGLEFCKVFTTLKNAQDYSQAEEMNMEDSNNFAHRAMDMEEQGGTGYDY